MKRAPAQFVTTDEEAAELAAPPSPEELARLRAKWQARVPGALGGLLDARLEEFINDEATGYTERATA